MNNILAVGLRTLSPFKPLIYYFIFGLRNSKRIALEVIVSATSITGHMNLLRAQW